MMEMTMRAMTPAEHNYCYAQSRQISMQSGLIGHLRADMGSDGRAFYSNFFDCQPELKTEAFRSELNGVINALRAAPLKDRSTLAAYCREQPDSGIDHDGREYGFRADTPEHSFMLRLNPNRGEYNLYCYCYQRRCHDQHISNYEDLGAGEVLLVYSEDMLVQDVNGQEIDLADLSAENRIRVELAPWEKIPGSEGYLDPVIESITLLPTGSDEYI